MCGQHVKCAVAVRNAGWQIVAGDIKAARFLRTSLLTYLFTYLLTYFMEQSLS